MGVEVGAGGNLLAFIFVDFNTAGDLWVGAGDTLALNFVICNTVWVGCYLGWGLGHTDLSGLGHL